MEAMIEEYKTLREEILQKQRLRVQIIAVSYAAVGVLVGLPFRPGTTTEPKTVVDACVAIFPVIALYAILIGGLITIRVLSEAIKLMGAYISECIEKERPEIGLCFETRLMAYKRLEGGRLTTKFGKAIQGHLAVHGALVIAAFFYTAIKTWIGWQYVIESKQSLTVGAIVVTAGLLALVIWSFALIGKLEGVERTSRDYAESWRVVKEREASNESETR